MTFQPLIHRVQADFATLISIAGAIVTLQTINLVVSICAGLIACVAGGWAIWDRWEKRKARKKALEAAKSSGG